MYLFKNRGSGQVIDVSSDIAQIYQSKPELLRVWERLGQGSAPPPETEDAGDKAPSEPPAGPGRPSRPGGNVPPLGEGPPPAQAGRSSPTTEAPTSPGTPLESIGLPPVALTALRGRFPTAEALGDFIFNGNDLTDIPGIGETLAGQVQEAFDAFAKP